MLINSIYPRIIQSLNILALQKVMEIPVNDYLVGVFIPRTEWTQIKPTEDQVTLKFPLKGIIVHHTAISVHQCNRSGKIFDIFLFVKVESLSFLISY